MIRCKHLCLEGREVDLVGDRERLDQSASASSSRS